MFEYKTASLYRRKTIKRKRPLSHKRSPRKKQKALWSGITKFSYKIEHHNQEVVITQMLQEVFEKSSHQAVQIVYNCRHDLVNFLHSFEKSPVKGIKVVITRLMKEGKGAFQVEIEKNEKEFVG